MVLAKPLVTKALATAAATAAEYHQQMQAFDRGRRAGFLSPPATTCCPTRAEIPTPLPYDLDPRAWA